MDGREVLRLGPLVVYERPGRVAAMYRRLTWPLLLAAAVLFVLVSCPASASPVAPSDAEDGRRALLMAGLVWAAVCGYGVFLLVRRWLERRAARREPEPGAPEEPIVAEDDTTPIDMPAGMMNPCPHGIPVSEPCPQCNGVMKGKHVTLEDDELRCTCAPYTFDKGADHHARWCPMFSKVPPPPPVGPRGAA